MKIDELFKTDNSLSGITDADYISAMHQIENTEAFCRLSCQAVYVIDFYKKKILRACGDFTHLYGMSNEDVMKEGLSLYMSHIPFEDLTILRDIHEMASSFCGALSEAVQTQCTCHCDLRIKNGSKYRLIHHQATPFLIRNGRPWIVMCTISFSSNDSVGNLCVKINGTRTIYKCALDSHLWKKQELPPLRDLERDIIILSTQGKTMREIAETLCKSEDTIKACKRELFRKCGTKNIQQTIQFVLNYKLL